MQKNRRKVVVTGVSAIAPNGIGWRDFWTNSLSGVSGCREITGFPITDGFSKVAGVVNNFYPESKFSIDDMGLPSNRLSLLAEFAVREALDEAGLLHDNQIRAGYEKTALCLSSAIGQMGSMESAYLKEYVYHQQADQYEMDSFSFSDITRRIVQLFGLQGGHTVIPTGCVGGCDAVSYGVHSIRVGRENRVIVGAAEAPITPLVLAAFGRIGANSTRACLPHEASCPFDMDRDGFVIGEGAGILILEDEISALERGATIWAEVKGTGSVCNAYHMTDLHPSGADIAKSCEVALTDANLRPDEIDFINAHGSSTPQNDVAEAAAYRIVFGENSSRIPVTALKSQNGHALSAANAMEMVSSVLSIRYQMAPPTINLFHPDPACQLDVLTSAREVTIRNILKTSSGFSGLHSALIVSQY